MKITIENGDVVCSISFNRQDIGDMLQAALLAAGFNQQTIFDTFYDTASYMHDCNKELLSQKYRNKSLGI